ncbi:MAG: glycosyltransferase family 2 protein [Pseudomonadales bacterium]|nr:glycosyltransferase family 2 protein [Pseudomonadales bacterium]MBO7004767.1 glycosyltransferase family 2 protein [Pseudomonadales bacterium]
MSGPVPVTVMVFTLNEQVNLPHCLGSLDAFNQIIVVDSFSVDETEKIARDAGVEFYQHEFTGFGDQRNWALENLELRNDWILILDADERVPAELASEIATKLQDGHSAYRVRRRFHLWGRWLRRSSLYPTWVVRLVHKSHVHYENRGHAETQEIQGTIGNLEYDLIDENRKGLDDWYERQLRYAGNEAEYEWAQEREPINVMNLFSADPMTRRHVLKRLAWKMPARAMLYFFYSYILRLGVLDGLAGYRFCMMKASYQHMIVVKKAELDSA